MPRVHAETEVAQQLLLADQRFGDYRFVGGLAYNLYGFAMEVLASESGRPMQDWLPLATDPPVRALLDEYLNEMRRASAGPDHATYASRAASMFRDYRDGQPSLLVSTGCAEPLRLQDVRTDWVLLDGSRPSVPGPDQFQRLFDRAFKRPRRFELSGPTEDDRAGLRAGVTRLQETLPDLGHDTLRYIKAIGVVDGEQPFRSASNRVVPGTIFVCREGIDDPGAVAESLFHEALHLKLYDLYSVRSVLPPGYDSESAPTVTATWNPSRRGSDTNRWPIDRALAAAHVYVHLTLLYTAQHTLELTSDRALGTPEVATERAEHLLQGLHGHLDAFGPDGRELVDWLSTVLHELKR